jgi:hypothetical protein
MNTPLGVAVRNGLRCLNQTRIYLGETTLAATGDKPTGVTKLRLRNFYLSHLAPMKRPGSIRASCPVRKNRIRPNSSQPLAGSDSIQAITLGRPMKGRLASYMCSSLEY